MSTIRPLREMTGRALFNEVFFDDAVVDDADLIGGLNNGWAVANTTLFFERSGIGAGSGGGGFPPPGTKEGYLDLRAGDVADDASGRATTAASPSPSCSRSHASAVAPTTRCCARSWRDCTR